MRNNITGLIKSIASKDAVIQTCAAKVIKINTEENSLHSPADAYTVNVMRADGAILKNVRLKASIQDREEGIIAIPKLNSWVLISIIDGIETRAFVTECAEVERSFVRFKNEENQYLEIDTTADLLAVTFKATKENSEGQTTENEIPEYNTIAKIELSSLAADTENPKPSIVTSMFDTEGKEVSKNTFTGTQQETILNTVDGDTVKERINLNISTEGSSIASLTFTGDDDSVKQELTFNEEHTQISLNDGNTNLVVKDNDVQLSTDSGSGYSASIKDNEVVFSKDDLTFKMDDKFKIAAGGTDLLSELSKIIDEIKLITVTTPVGPSGTPINSANFTILKNDLTNLLQ